MKDNRLKEIERIKKRLMSARPMDIDGIIKSMIASASDVALHIEMDCKARGYSDKSKTATINSLMHQIYRRYEMLGTEKPVDDKDDTVYFGVQLPEPQKQIDA